MTPQEVFDQIVNGLRAQGSKSIALNKDGTPKTFTNGSPICMYRSPDGKKCGAGQVILDEEYDPDMEEITFTGVLERSSTPASMKVRLAPHELLVGHLQRIHDYTAVENWEQQFQDTASNFYVIYTPPKSKQ